MVVTPLWLAPGRRMTWAAATSASIATRSARRMLRRLTCFQDVEQGSRTVYSVSLRLVDEPQDPGGSQLVNRPLRCRERDAQSLLHEPHRAVRVLSDDVNELQRHGRGTSHLGPPPRCQRIDALGSTQRVLRLARHAV